MNSYHSNAQQNLFTRRFNYFKKQIQENHKINKNLPNWWTPLWRGLIADTESKHRKAMGSAIWLYLYLLTYSNRITGIVRRTQESIKKDTGYPLRTIQLHLSKLKRTGYLTSEREGRHLKIKILKWKAFKKVTHNDQRF
jgi:DNA-binding transcriptional ArsR family regulator